MEATRKNKNTMLYIIKDIAEKNNVTNHEISENTGVSEGTLSRLMRGVVSNPRKNVIDAIYNYLTTHYSHNEATYNTQEKFTMDRQEKLKKVKSLIKKYNVTAYEISKNTSLTAAGVQKIINGQSEKPLIVTLDTIINYIESNYSHNGTTHNTQNNNNNGDNNNIYNINNTGSITTQQEAKEQGKKNENNIYTEMIATQRDLIDSLKEQILQYREEIEYLRQRIKEK